MTVTCWAGVEAVGEPREAGIHAVRGEHPEVALGRDLVGARVPFLRDALLFHLRVAGNLLELGVLVGREPADALAAFQHEHVAGAAFRFATTLADELAAGGERRGEAHRLDLAPDLAEDIGSRRWLRVAGLNFQVSEVARVLVLVFIASYAVRREKELRETFAGLLKPLGLLFVFFVLHAIGAHYTYSEVPYDAWAQALTGSSVGEVFGWQRNHYDRLVHFLYGLLVTPAAIALLDRRAPQQGLWRWLLPWLFMVSHSTLYEIIEFAAAVTFGGDLGQAYVGTQGDVWDAQKDSALAAIGAAIAVVWCRQGWKS